MTMLGEQIHYILNLTIHYPSGNFTYWDYVTGKLDKIDIYVKSIEVDDSLRGNYIEDAAFRAEFQTWLTAEWQEKDALLESLKGKHQSS